MTFKALLMSEGDSSADDIAAAGDRDLAPGAGFKPEGRRQTIADGWRGLLAHCRPAPERNGTQDLDDLPLAGVLRTIGGEIASV